MARPDADPVPSRELPLLWTTTAMLLASRLLLPVAGVDGTARALDSISRWAPPYRNTVKSDRIAWAVRGVASRAPLPFTCLMQALVGQSLLEAHGHSAAIRYGVTSGDEGDLRAHAWVERDGSVLIGNLDNLAQYQLIYEQTTGD
jgi:hypothetical protein